MWLRRRRKRRGSVAALSAASTLWGHVDRKHACGAGLIRSSSGGGGGGGRGSSRRVNCLNNWKTAVHCPFSKEAVRKELHARVGRHQTRGHQLRPQHPHLEHIALADDLDAIVS